MYILLLSPVQEFIYRGVLTAILKQRNISNKIILIFTSILYSFVHIIYLDIVTLILTFIIGMIWHKIYMKTENLIGVSISHSVLGAVTIVLGIIN